MSESEISQTHEGPTTAGAGGASPLAPPPPAPPPTEPQGRPQIGDTRPARPPVAPVVPVPAGVRPRVMAAPRVG